MNAAPIPITEDTPAAHFDALVERQSRFLYRVAFSLLRNPQDAEDAVQETLLKLYRTQSWRGLSDERAFLARTVWRVGLNRLATRANTPAHTHDVTEIPLASPDASPEQNALDGAQRALLRRLIDALPNELRHPLLLSAIDGMTSREVATALAIPEGTVRTRLLRARTELKRRFENQQSQQALQKEARR